MAGKRPAKHVPEFIQVLSIQIGDTVTISTRVCTSEPEPPAESVAVLEAPEVPAETALPEESVEEPAGEEQQADSEVKPEASGEEPAEPKVMLNQEIQTEEVKSEEAEVMDPDHQQCFLTAARKSKTDLYGLLESDIYMVEHSNVMRFQIESADLLLTQFSREETEDVKEVKIEAAKQIREKSKGAKLECGVPFALRNVEYDMYLALDTENASKGEVKLTLSTKLVAEALFVMKGSALVSGLSTYMEYNLPGILLTAHNYSLAATNTNSQFWSIAAKDKPIPWTFHKYEDANVSDSYVRYMTPVRLKVKNSNYYLSTKSLEVAYGSIVDNPAALTTDPDNIACYFLLVQANFKGGYVEWNQPFYLRHAVNANFFDYDADAKKLGYNDVCTERFQVLLKTSKASSPNVRFNLPVALWTYKKESKVDPIDKDKLQPLSVSEPNSSDQALSLAATFDSKYVTDDICGTVCVSEGSGELFEIQPVAYEDTLPYRGLNIMLTVIASIRKCFRDINQEDIARIQEGDRDLYTEVCADILVNLQEVTENLAASVKQLQGEIKAPNISMAEVVIKQKIMMQANVPTELVLMLLKLSSVMGAKWKRDNLIKDEEEASYGSDGIGSEENYEEYDEEEEEGSAPAESEEGGSQGSQGEPEEQPDFQPSEEEGSQPSEGISGVEEAKNSGPNSEQASEAPELDEDTLNRVTDLLNSLSEPSYQIFKRTLDFILECIKSFAPGCKKMLSVEKQLFEMFEFGRESVGRIFAEVFTYAFPTGIDRDEYLQTVCGHFTSSVSKDNIEEQLIYARMLNKLMIGDSLEGKVFAQYTFDRYTSELKPENANFRFLERNKKFYVHFLLCEASTFETNNPALAGLEKVTEGDFTYYLLAGMDAKYVEFVENFLYLHSGFNSRRLPDVLAQTFGVTSGMMQRMVVSLDTPISLRIAAIYTFSSILTNQLKTEEEKLIVNLKAPVIAPPVKSLPLDLAVEGASSDIKEAIRLTLTLAQPTESFFTPRPAPAEKADKEAEDKAEVQSNLDKVRLISGLFGVSLALIRLGKVEQPYIYEIMNIVKVGLQLVSPKEKNEADKTPQYWFPLATRAVLDKALKNFEAKTAIEELYDCLLQTINATVDFSLRLHLPKYPLAIKSAYDRFMQSGLPLEEPEILSLFENDIVPSSRSIFLESSLFPTFVKDHTVPPAAPTTPLLSDTQSSLVAYYGLDHCTLTTEETLLSVMTGLLVNAMPLGLKFDQLLVEGIMKALKTRKAAAAKMSEFLFVEEDGKLIELRAKCDFTQINDLLEELTENDIERVRKLIYILLDNPLVCGSKLLANFDYRYAAQSYMNLNPENIQLVCYLLDRVDKADKENEDDVDRRQLCFVGRCAALRFLTNFISNNSACKQTLLKYLRPSHLTHLIPEVADLIRELFDFDFLSSESTRIVFTALMQEFKKPGPTAYYALYYLKSILYDRSGKFKTSVQNLIIEILGQDFEKLIKKMISVSGDFEEKGEEGAGKAGEEGEAGEAGEAEKQEAQEEEGSGEEEDQEEQGEEGEPVAQAAESAPSEEEGEGSAESAQDSKTLQDGDYFYIEFCLMLLGHCSVGNDIVQGHIRTLNLLTYMEEILKANKEKYGLVSSVLQVVNAAYAGTALGEEDAKYLETALAIVLDMTEEVLKNESGLIDVITSNYYAMIPSRGMVPLSCTFSNILPEQMEALKQLQFLLNGSARDIPSGIVVAFPAALTILQKSERDVSQLKMRFLELLPRIGDLFERVADEEQTFDLGLCRTKLKAARMEDEMAAALLTSGSRALNQMSGLSSLLKSRPSFISPLSQLYDAIRTHCSFFHDIEADMAHRLVEMCTAKKLTRACRCIKKLMCRIPIRPFFDAAANFSSDLKDEEMRGKALKTFIQSGIITDSIVKLLDDKRITSDRSILNFLNSILKDQSSELIIAIKDQLVKQLLDKDLLATIVREFSDSIKIITATTDVNLPVSSYMPLLARFDYKTYGQDSRRAALIEQLSYLISSYLTLLQRLCDGCNLEMQNYVRSQGDSEGIDVVKLVTDYLCTILSLVKGSLFESSLRGYVEQSVNALIEFATGPCTPNQNMIGRYVPLYIALNKLFEAPPSLYYSWEIGSEKVDFDYYTSLRAAGIKMLLVLLEGSPSLEVVKCMDKFLLKDQLLDNIKRVYSAYGQKYRTQITTEDPSVEPILALVKNAMNEACFLVTLLSKNEDQKLNEIVRDVEDLNAFKEFYMPYIGYVEIDKPAEGSDLPASANIRDIYFVVPFKCKFLPYETAKALVVDANHDSHQDLVEGLLKAAKPCKEEMEYHQAIARDPKNEYILSQWRNFKVASLVLVFLTNLMLLVASEPEYYMHFVWDSWISYIAVLLFGIGQIVLYTAGTVFYVLDAKPTLLAEEEDEGISMEDLAVQTDRDDQEQKYKEALSRAEDTQQAPAAQWPKLVLAVKLDIFYLLVSLVAIPFPMFYPMLLFQIFAHVPELRTVLQAITQNKVQLLYTGIFGLIVLFCMTIICFVHYRDSFVLTDNDMTCDGMLECYLSVVNQGLRAGGGLGDVLGAPEKDGWGFWTRMAFDFLFFIAISVILLQIIFGIILDAFGDMRDKRGDLLEDINSVCFVCGKGRSDLELYGKGWTYHFQNEHSPYAYLSFFIYLLDKDTSDCSGVEKFAKEKLVKIDTTFLPSTSKLLALRTSE